MSRYNDLLVWDNRMEPPYDGWDWPQAGEDDEGCEMEAFGDEDDERSA